MSTITPKGLTRFIVDFCKEINPNAKPYYIPVKPIQFNEYNESFSNVERKIKSNGGTVQYGWAIWEWRNILIEAEFHAVWKNPEGELICVSPNIYKEYKILFLPDDTRIYDGVHKIDSYRKSIRIEPIVDEYIAVKEQFFCEYIAQIGKTELSPNLIELAKKDHELRLEVDKLPPLPNRNSVCLCGSNKRYKDCCGSDHEYIE
ncbi:hypothetical protein SCACP_12520 [Sporomusa carbonis]|uniref:SEC-C metal-binding domain-containing protein n=1 Tax=Sporomusa carbonis TaxID=3076075 RepID=UPI003A7A4C01